MIIFLSLLLSAWALWVWIVILRSSKGLKQPPFLPWLLPFIGHVHLLVGTTRRLWNTIEWSVKKNIELGGVARAIFGFDVYYIISDPEDALTASNACLQKHFVYDYAKPWLGDGLATGSGEIYKRHRRLLAPSFGLPVVYSFLGIFNSQSRKLVKLLKSEVSNGPIDQMSYLRKIAFETFCLTAFGIDCIDEKYVGTYMHSVDQIMGMITDRFSHPWLQSDLVYKLSGKMKTFEDHVAVLKSMSNEVIQTKRAIKNSNKIPRSSGTKQVKAFLDLLLELSGEDALTDKELREEVDTAILTGFDSTSMVNTFTTILLGSYPEVQEKMYKEIKEIFPTDRDVEVEDIAKLVYTEAVIKECSRYLTSGPLSLRYVDKNVQLKNCTMPAGSQCIIFLNGIHRHSLWGNDADQFRPERWLEPDLGHFVGFSLGKRSCVGKLFAMVSMKTTLVHLLRNYKLHADQAKLIMKYEFLAKPVSGHEMSIEER